MTEHGPKRCRSAVLPCLIVAYTFVGILYAAIDPSSGVGASMIGVALVWTLGLWAAER